MGRSGQPSLGRETGAVASSAFAWLNCLESREALRGDWGTYLASLSCVRRLYTTLVLLALITAGSTPANAAPRGRTTVSAKDTSRARSLRRAKRPRPPSRNTPELGAIQRRPNPWKKLNQATRNVITRWKETRLGWIRNRGQLFRRITQDRNYDRDYVVFRNNKVTAFLDWSDPLHPQFDPKRKTGEQHMLDPIPVERRSHILVIPNTPREHIAATLGAQITSKDLDAAQQTIKAAEKLAKKLGIANPKVWINSPSAISVGYLHVHIVGEKTKDYPAALSAPTGR